MADGPVTWHACSPPPQLVVVRPSCSRSPVDVGAQQAHGRLALCGRMMAFRRAFLHAFSATAADMWLSRLWLSEQILLGVWLFNRLEELSNTRTSMRCFPPQQELPTNNNCFVMPPSCGNAAHVHTAFYELRHVTPAHHLAAPKQERMSKGWSSRRHQGAARLAAPAHAAPCCALAARMHVERGSVRVQIRPAHLQRRNVPPAASLLCGLAMEGAPPAKKRKSKNKFKPASQSAAQPAAPPPAATAAGQAKKKQRKKRKQPAAVDETVAAQPDAPGAVQQQQRRAPPPPPAGRGGAGGRSVFAPPAASSGGKKAKGRWPDA